MGIEVVDTRYYDKLPILYTHVKKRPCGLDVDEQVLGTHYRLHRSREVIYTPSAA